MARTSINSMIEALLLSQPNLMNVSDDSFIEVVRDSAKMNGLATGQLPKPWTILRTRYAVKAKLSGKNRR